MPEWQSGRGIPFDQQYPAAQPGAGQSQHLRRKVQTCQQTIAIHAFLRTAQQLTSAAAQVQQASAGSQRLERPVDALVQGSTADELVTVFVVGAAVLPIDRALEFNVT